jgi:hypothetical protein
VSSGSISIILSHRSYRDLLERPVLESRWPDLLFRRHLLPRDLGLRLRHGHGSVANRRIFLLRGCQSPWTAGWRDRRRRGLCVEYVRSTKASSCASPRMARWTRTVENETSVIFGGPNLDIDGTRREGSPTTRAGIWGLFAVYGSAFAAFRSRASGVDVELGESNLELTSLSKGFRNRDEGDFGLTGGGSRASMAPAGKLGPLPGCAGLRRSRRRNARPYDHARL